MSADRPSPVQLWCQAGGDSARYRELMREHGHILVPGDEGYEQASAALPCGWPGPQKPASEFCIHEMPPGTCSICTGRGEQVPGEGDTIRRDGDGGYVCERCAS